MAKVLRVCSYIKGVSTDLHSLFEARSRRKGKYIRNVSFSDSYNILSTILYLFSKVLPDCWFVVTMLSTFPLVEPPDNLLPVFPYMDFHCEWCSIQKGLMFTLSQSVQRVLVGSAVHMKFTLKMWCAQNSKKNWGIWETNQKIIFCYSNILDLVKFS